MESRWGAVDGHEIIKRIKETHELFGIFQISRSKNTKSLEEQFSIFSLPQMLRKSWSLLGRRRFIKGSFWIRGEKESEGDQELLLPSFQPQLVWVALISIPQSTAFEIVKRRTFPENVCENLVSFMSPSVLWPSTFLWLSPILKLFWYVELFLFFLLSYRV